MDKRMRDERLAEIEEGEHTVTELIDVCRELLQALKAERIASRESHLAVKMTDERLAEVYALSCGDGSFEKELLSALKAERERIAELERQLAAVRALPDKWRLLR